ncbi:translation initiation factor IF-2-like [Trachypithecus francoisi]|uniref:translation initiation factor IF-2-like n=1 Tax=Trachypithecus francoisi TaxID=54180 RepID=UPI00141B8FE9|nr:translation initiation factor IF-2-like [Trachypithecus francoisi]
MPDANPQNLRRESNAIRQLSSFADWVTGIAVVLALLLGLVPEEDVVTVDKMPAMVETNEVRLLSPAMETFEVGRERKALREKVGPPGVPAPTAPPAPGRPGWGIPRAQWDGGRAGQREKYLEQERGPVGLHGCGGRPPSSPLPPLGEPPQPEEATTKRRRRRRQRQRRLLNMAAPSAATSGNLRDAPPRRRARAGGEPRPGRRRPQSPGPPLGVSAAGLPPRSSASARWRWGQGPRGGAGVGPGAGMGRGVPPRGGVWCCGPWLRQL